MQKQNNNGIDRLVQWAHPIFDYLIFFLHMFVTCYLTLMLYFALGPETSGSLCIFGFFLDWNLIALFTLPFMHLGKKFLRHPIGFIVMVILFFTLMLLFARLSQENILLTVKDGVQHYRPVMLQILG